MPWEQLRDHDAAVIRSAVARLERGGEKAFDDALWASLAPLLGRCDELDDLLRRDERSFLRCLAVLQAFDGALRPVRSRSIPSLTH